MGRGGLRAGPEVRGRPTQRRSSKQIEALIRGGLRRSERLADEAVGGAVNGELWAVTRRRGRDKLWAPFDPGNRRVVSTRDARRALRSVGVDVSYAELDSVDGGGAPRGHVRYDALAGAEPEAPEKPSYSALYREKKELERRARPAEDALVDGLSAASEVAPLRRRLRQRDASRSGELAPRDFKRALHDHYGSALDDEDFDALCDCYSARLPSCARGGQSERKGLCPETRHRRNHNDDDDAMRASLHRAPEGGGEALGRAPPTHFEPLFRAVDYELFLSTLESRADEAYGHEAPHVAAHKPAAPRLAPPPPFATGDATSASRVHVDDGAASLLPPKEEVSGYASDGALCWTAAGRRAARKVARVLEDDGARDRWMRSVGPRTGEPVALQHLAALGVDLTPPEARFALKLGTADDAFCGRRLVKTAIKACDAFDAKSEGARAKTYEDHYAHCPHMLRRGRTNVRSTLGVGHRVVEDFAFSDARPTRRLSAAERRERLSLERAAQAVARTCGGDPAKRRAALRDALDGGDVAASLAARHHVLAPGDAGRLASAASSLTKPLAEALEGVLFRGKDAVLSARAPSPRRALAAFAPAPRRLPADLPLSCSDAEPSTVVSIPRHPPPMETAARPAEHRAADAAVARAAAAVVAAPSPTFASSDLTLPFATHPVRGRGSSRRADTHIWKFPEGSHDEPLYASTRRCVAASSSCARIGRRRSHSAPPRPLLPPPVDPGRPATLSPAAPRRARSSSCRPAPRPLATFL